MFDAYIDADWAAQSKEREGGLQQMISVEIDRSAEAVLILAGAIAAGCGLLMLLSAALIVSTPAAVVLVGAVSMLFVLLRPVTSRIRHHAVDRSAEELGVAQSLNELLRTAEEIRVHGVGAQQKSRLSFEPERVAEWVVRLQFSSLSISSLYQGAALGLVLGALFVVSQLDPLSLLAQAP